MYKGPFKTSFCIYFTSAIVRRICTEIRKSQICRSGSFVVCSCHVHVIAKIDGNQTTINNNIQGYILFQTFHWSSDFYFLLCSNMKVELKIHSTNIHIAFNINSMYFFKYIIAPKRIALSEMEMCKALHVSHKRIEKSKTCSHVVTARLHHRKSGADFCILRWSTTSYLQYICIPFVVLAIIPSISLQHQLQFM